MGLALKGKEGKKSKDASPGGKTGTLDQAEKWAWEPPCPSSPPNNLIMAPHFSILAWKIPWTEEPDRLQSKGLQRVRHDRATNTKPLLGSSNLSFQL